MSEVLKNENVSLQRQSTEQKMVTKTLETSEFLKGRKLHNFYKNRWEWRKQQRRPVNRLKFGEMCSQMWVLDLRWERGKYHRVDLRSIPSDSIMHMKTWPGYTWWESTFSTIQITAWSFDFEEGNQMSKVNHALVHVNMDPRGVSIDERSRRKKKKVARNCSASAKNRRRATYETPFCCWEGCARVSHVVNVTENAKHIRVDSARQKPTKVFSTEQKRMLEGQKPQKLMLQREHHIRIFTLIY